MKHSTIWLGATLLAALVSCSSLPEESKSIPDFPRRGVVQEAPVWCWAACTQMVLAHYDIEEDQNAIATRIHGTNPDDTARVQAASKYEIACALAGVTGPDRVPFDLVWKGFLDSAKRYDPVQLQDASVSFGGAKEASELAALWLPTTSVTLQDMRDLSKHPMVVGLRDSQDDSMGHAYVLYGARFVPRTDGGWQQQMGKAGGLFGGYQERCKA